MMARPIADIMTEHVVTLGEEATVSEAAHILMRQRINGLFITASGNAKKVLAVFTTTDLLKILDLTMCRRNHKIDVLAEIGMQPAIEYATRKVLRIDCSTPIAKALAIMHKKNIHTLPIFDGEVLVGVVGRHDILNYAFSGGK